MVLDHRLLYYVIAVMSVFLDLSHSRAFVHDPPVIKTEAQVDGLVSHRATADSAGTLQVDLIIIGSHVSVIAMHCECMSKYYRCLK